MAFPTTPTDGQTATVNNIVYVYSSATNTWTRTATGFVNLGASGNISAIGNIYGGNIIGSIVGNVVAVTAATVTSNAQPNITSVGTLTSLTSSGLISTAGNIVGNYIFGNNVNATSVNTTFDGSANTFYLAYVAQNGANSQVVYNSPFLTYVSSTGVLGASAITATGNVTGGNIRTAGFVSATGNVTGNYILGNGALLTGVITSVANINNGNSNVTVVSSGGNVSVGIGGTANVAVFATTGEYITGVVSASGNVTGANILTAGLISATGNISANYFIGNGSQLSSITGGNVTGQVANAVIAGTVYTNAQPNITTVGTLTSLNSGVISSSGNVTGANILTAGLITATGNITGNYFIGNGSLLTGITSGSGIRWTTSNTAPSSPAPGDFWYNGNTSIKYQYTNDGTGNVWVDQSFPTSFSTLAVTGNGTIGGTFVITGNTSGSNILASGSVSATGNVTGGNVLTAGAVSATGNVTGNYILGNGSLLTGITSSGGSNISNGTSNVTVVSSGGNVTVGVGGTANIAVFASTGISVSGTVAGNGNITGGNVLTGGLISATGNITGGNVSVGTGTITVGNIVNANGNGVGNIGSSSLYFNTIFAKATSAQYADLAEMYVADQDYAAGTVVEFGGTQEITATQQSHSVLTVGIISTNPSYLMNATQVGEHVLPVALIGRVPCRVTGPISRGDRLVASHIPGVAQRLNMLQYQPGCIIGKALEEYTGDDVGTIEVLVGKI
jgi:hypothetical protein